MAKNTKRSKSGDLRALLKLVDRHDGATNKKRKAALGTQISQANDRFYYRWQQDGVALLLKQNAEYRKRLA